MLLAYMFAQLLPWVRGRQGGLLVLGSANVDERYINWPERNNDSLLTQGPVSEGISRNMIVHQVSLSRKQCIHELTSSDPADINPIGGISKTDLKKFIAYAQDVFDIPILNELV
jgi:NAD+ synthase (glutamine-hydrolysing)